MRLFAFLNKWGPLILSGFKGKMAGYQNSLQIKQKYLKKQRVFIKPIIFIQQCLIQILQYPNRTLLVSQSDLLNYLCSVANRDLTGVGPRQLSRPGSYCAIWREGNPSQ